MKKLLLVKPPYASIPIGIAYVLATLRENSIPFDFLDLYDPVPDIGKILARDDYFAVASGGLVSEFVFFRELFGVVKKARPALPIILGGNITSSLPGAMIFEDLGADVAVLGEAETALPGLAARLDVGGGDLSGLPGLMYRDGGGKIVKTRPQTLDLGLADPKPAWDLFDTEAYLSRCRHHCFSPEKPFMPILTGRGCTGKCSFCSPTLGRFRPRRFGEIFAEMRQALARYSFGLFGFQTEVFFSTEEEIADFCRQYREQGFDREWFCSLRLDIDPGVLDVMRDSGCIGVSVGFESASDAILKSMKKGITAARGRAFIRAAKALSIPLECNIMAGNEGETLDDLRQSFDMLRQERVDSNVNLTIAYAGTLIFANAVKRGLVPSVKEQIAGEKYVGLNYPDIAQHRYLNISAFATLEDLHNAVMGLNRQTTGELLDGFASSPFIRIQGRGIEAVWRCRACASDNPLDSTKRPFDGLVRRRFCAHCGAFSYVRMLPPGVRSGIARELRGRGRIVVQGVDANAHSLMAYPLDGLDHEKILCFADYSTPMNANWRFFFHKLATPRQASLLLPDAVLNVSRDLAFRPAANAGHYRGDPPPLVQAVPNLFPADLMTGRRVIFIGNDALIDWLRPAVQDIKGTLIAGVIGMTKMGAPRPQGAKDLPRLGLRDLFGPGWDVAVMLPDVYAPGLAGTLTRLAAFAAVLISGKPVLRRVDWIPECVAWIPWRRVEIVARAVEWASRTLREAIFRRWSWKQPPRA